LAVIYPWLETVGAEFVERLQSKRLPHALLLSGPEGTGKLDLSAEFVASVLCLQGTYPACGNCRSCQLLSSGAHPDRHTVTFEIHPKTGELRKELVIEQVRRLIASLNLTNSVGERKAALIHPVESINRPAANALLKTLEEPPGDTVLVLVSHDPSRLPATIRSRCQNLHVRPPESGKSLAWLCQSCETSRAEAEAALEAAAGSPLRARDMLTDGTTGLYRTVISTLDDLRTGTIEPASAMAALADVDPDRLWSWISLRAAGGMKTELHNRNIVKSLSKLQSQADWNRKLVSTPVRKDLLLQDWLIQWARLKA
jgi:DNA polymerase-3 subunit delta'